MRRRFLGLLIVIILAASCSGTPDSENVAAQPGLAERDAEGSEPAELALSDRLRLALARPETYVPPEVSLTDQSGVIVADLLYDGLTEAAGEGELLRPGLATDWQANSDFTTWTFQLDPSSGVSAADVVASLASFAQQGGGGEDEAAAATRDEASSGRRSPGAAAVLVAGIRSVASVGDHAVLIELNRSNAGLPWILSGLPYSIVGVDDAATGDYELVSDDANGMILQQRLTGSEGNPASQSELPAEIDIRWPADPDQGYELLERGEVDAAIVDGVGLQAARLRFDAEQTITAATRFYVMNSRSEALQDIEVRRAVLAATTQPDLVANGFSQPVAFVDGLVGSTMVGYLPVGACAMLCRHAPDEAANFLATDGPVRIQVSSTGADQERLAAMVVDQLLAAGFEAADSRLEVSELASVIVSGETDLFAFGWVSPAVSTDALVPPLLRAESPANIARIDSVEMKQLLDQASVTGDDAQRWQLLAEAHRLAMAEALILPVAASTSTLVRGPTLQDLAVRADGSIDLDSLS